MKKSTKLYDKNGKEYNVPFAIDRAEWLGTGKYFEQNPKTEEDEYDREALKTEATSLGLEFPANLGNKKLFELIEAKKSDEAE